MEAYELPRNPRVLETPGSWNAEDSLGYNEAFATEMC